MPLEVRKPFSDGALPQTPLGDGGVYSASKDPLACGAGCPLPKNLTSLSALFKPFGPLASTLRTSPLTHTPKVGGVVRPNMTDWVRNESLRKAMKLALIE